MYRGPEKDGKYALLMGGQIIHIKYWTEYEEGKKQELYYYDRSGKAWFSYAHEVRKYSNRKWKLRRFYKKYLRS